VERLLALADEAKVVVAVELLPMPVHQYQQLVRPRVRAHTLRVGGTQRSKPTHDRLPLRLAAAQFLQLRRPHAQDQRDQKVLPVVAASSGGAH